MVSICTSSVSIKFAYVYAQEGRVWLQVTAFFLIERRKILIKILIKIFERCSRQVFETRSLVRYFVSFMKKTLFSGI